ncbi:RNA polymerase sigma factor [Sphingopyxis indica]|nr:RNA polymerase sigma factor [Sphingopyxis indica]
MPASRPDSDIEAWVSAYGPGLRRYFRRRASEADVDDLVQDVFLRLQAAKFSAPIDNVEGYLFATARNVLIDAYRQRARSNAAAREKWAAEAPTSDPLSPERIAIGQDEYRRVVEAIVNLPPRAREAFELHRFEHLTYQAIAQRMGITKESVKELMHRALVRIAEDMEVGQ